MLYTTDGSNPIPGSAGTAVFNQSSPIVLASHGASVPVKAIAIGPNMYPSLLTDQTITLSYQQVATPTFSPAPGNFSNDQSGTITTATAGASGEPCSPVDSPCQRGLHCYVDTGFSGICTEYCNNPEALVCAGGRAQCCTITGNTPSNYAVCFSSCA